MSLIQRIGTDAWRRYVESKPNFIDLETVPRQRIGTATNNTTFQDDGTMVLNGTATVFDDLTEDITRTKTVGTRVTVNDTELCIAMTDLSTINDYATFVTQMSHSWKTLSKIYPHVHWEQTSAGRPNFLFQYRWQAQGVAKDVTWKNLAVNTNAFTYVSGTLNQISGTTVGITPPANAGLSDILQIRFVRDVANTSTVFAGADAYSGTVNVTSVDCHYEINSMGSKEEYVK